MTSTASTITKITSVEKLQILTSLTTLVVHAFRQSLSTSVVTLGYTRLRGSISQVVTLLTSKVLQVDASFLFQVWAVKTTLAIMALKTLCLPARGIPHLPRSGGLVATSSYHTDPLSLKLCKPLACFELNPPWPGEFPFRHACTLVLRTAVIDILCFRFYIDLTFRMLVNKHFQKWWKVTV